LDGLHYFGGDLAWAGVNTSNATTHPFNEMAMMTSINILAWRGRQIQSNSYVGNNGASFGNIRIKGHKGTTITPKQRPQNAKCASN
jgi:hypothetical protein